jgi:8-oxo-dGTP diphosphatase
MKIIEVAAAVLFRNGEFFATQRGYGEFEGMWEFPGGKVESGESVEFALKREIREELCIDISIRKFLCTVKYKYPSFFLVMHCFLCCIESGEIELKEHKSSCWLSKGSLDSVDWLPADIEVVERLKHFDSTEFK